MNRGLESVLSGIFKVASIGLLSAVSLFSGLNLMFTNSPQNYALAEDIKYVGKEKMAETNEKRKAEYNEEYSKKMREEGLYDMLVYGYFLDKDFSIFDKPLKESESAIIMVNREDSTRVSFSEESIDGLNLSPDGKNLVLTGFRNERLFLLNMANKEVSVLETKGIFDSDVKGGVSWSPDGRKFSFVMGKSEKTDSSYYPPTKYAVFIANSDGSDIEQITTASDNTFCTKWSPTGDKILINSAGYIHIADINGKKLEKIVLSNKDIAKYPNENLSFFCWMPDGNNFLYTEQKEGREDRTKLCKYDLVNRTSEELADFYGAEYDFTVDNKGDKLAVATRSFTDEIIHIVDLKSRNTKKIAEISNKNLLSKDQYLVGFYGLKWSSNSRFLFFIAAKRTPAGHRDEDVVNKKGNYDIFAYDTKEDKFIPITKYCDIPTSVFMKGFDVLNAGPYSD